MFSGVFIAEELYGLGEKYSGYIITVDVQKLLKVFLKMFLRSACCNDETFFEKKIQVLGLFSSNATLFSENWTLD